ncbi:PREDICTED: protein FAM76B [Drosophila arizonae]|uniref:Protein FAM76B n=1 Tax=Drosophila arizonae TaxID=7263 RepID=A0ABM1PCX1_DROAR|nr:PREDICTED: protein FAM76B [Drosophila arizonae]
MSMVDYRLYLCSKCCRRCLWHELSPQEHRCARCRLPLQSCEICDRRFEPRDREELYCKRCDFHLIKQASHTPPPVLELDLDTETEPETEAEPDLIEPPRVRSMAQRWRDIKSAAGIEDDPCFLE